MIKSHENYTSVRLCPEAYEPLVRQEILKELIGTLGTSINYWSGCPEAENEYMKSIICDLGECDLGEADTPWIQERIFRHLLPASRSFPNHLSVYIKFFFSGIQGTVDENNPTARRLINRLVALTKNNSDRTRIAALNVLKRISENYKLIPSDKLLLIEEKALSTTREAIFEENTDLPTALIKIIEDYIDPPQFYRDNSLLLDPCQFIASVKEGKIEKEDLILIEGLNGLKLEVKFQGFDNIFFPFFMFYTDNEGNSSSFSLEKIFRVTHLVAKKKVSAQEVNQLVAVPASPNVLRQQPPASLPWYLAIQIFIWHCLVSFWDWLTGCFR